MNVSLSETNTPFVTGFVHLRTDMTLECLGEAISVRLTGGAPFGGRDHFICDEIPAIYVSHLLGGTLVLQGEGGEYNLCLEPYKFPFLHFEKTGKRPDEVDISGVLAAQLEGIPNLIIEFE